MAFIQTFENRKAFYAQCFNLQPLGGSALQTFNLYVNSVTGVDAGQGRGTSLTAPYRSLSVALKDAFAMSTKFQVIIHLAGATDHTLADGFVFPMVSSSDQVTTDSTPTSGLTQQAPLVIRATPTLVLTVPALSVVSQANNANSGLKEVTTLGGMVVGAYDGMWMIDANNVLARIESNDADQFFLCYAGADLTPPLLVQNFGATIAPTDVDNTNPTVVLRGGSAPVVFFGVSIEAPTASVAVQVGPNQQAIFVACTVPSMQLGCGEASEMCGDAIVEAIASSLGSFAAPQAEINLESCLISGGTITDMSQVTRVIASGCVFSEMASPLFFDGTNSAGFLQGTNLLVVDAVGNGVEMSGGKLLLTTCDIQSSGADGISCHDNCFAVLTAVKGSVDQTGEGLVCDSYSSVKVNSTTNIRGGTNRDLNVGGLPFQTWEEFRLGEKPNARFSAAQNSIVFEDDMGATSQTFIRTHIFVALTPTGLLPSDGVLLCDANAAIGTVQLPPIASCFGRRVTIKKIDATGNDVTIAGDGAETIDGAGTATLSVQWDTLTLIAGSGGWYLI